MLVAFSTVCVAVGLDDGNSSTPPILSLMTGSSPALSAPNC